MLRRRSSLRSAFTLIELLVVILIVIIISAVALPTVIPAISHRQVSEAARLVQGALVGARDAAVHANAPSGIRLLPDPAFSGIGPATYLVGTTATANAYANILDPGQPLAFNRVIPIGPAPEYSEGMVKHVDVTTQNFQIAYPILAADGSTTYWPVPSLNNVVAPGQSVVMISEAMLAKDGLPNEPTSWFWNVRVGDKMQINNTGLWYTVVGPTVISAPGTTIGGVFYANPEQFVNVGPPGTASPLTDTINGTGYAPEFLFLVDGQDNNGNGWVDEGFDGVDNNYAQETFGKTPLLTDELIEWEAEVTPKGLGTDPQPYTIQRRPAPLSGAREIALPTNVVIDASTWNDATRQRSRLPVNSSTGYVDILVYPNGAVVPTTIYSTPSSSGLASAFLHFWIAERSDVTGATVATGSPAVATYMPDNPKGQYYLITANAKTGNTTSLEQPDLIKGFAQAQQGTR